jgi:hypothetical protein
MTTKSIALPKLEYLRFSPILQKVIASVGSFPKDLYLTIIGKFRSRQSVDGEGYSGVKMERRSPFKKPRYKKLFRGFAVLVVTLVVLFGVTTYIKSKNNSDTKPAVQGAKASQEINREFTFPLKDESGEEVAKVKYELQKAEITDQIIVKGQKATAVKGRAFLILTLKITNEFSKPIQMETRDYVRLSVNGNENEWLAADIHNDPVEVQAISTKYSRLGFAIDDNATDLLLRVGEIDGDKELVPLELD